MVVRDFENINYSVPGFGIEARELLLGIILGIVFSTIIWYRYIYSLNLRKGNNIKPEVCP